MIGTPNTSRLETAGAWLLAGLWILPLAYAFWAAFHASGDATSLRLASPIVLDNFHYVWKVAPFPTYFLNTFMLVTLILVVQLVLATLAGFAFARYDFPFKNIIFGTILLQLMIVPEALMVENYRTINFFGLNDSILGMAVPYFASAFGIFLMRQTFKSIPKELDDAAVVEGATSVQVLWRVYVPLARPTLLAYGLVSVSYHWNNFLWPLIVSNSVDSRPLTVGLQVFSSVDQGINWSFISAATLLSVAPLLIAFLLFQKQFVQSFLRAGIR
ncbi:MAG: carbohydrate ABC transporter permease [Rhizobiaceae bacterium]|nr:MAG: carbohydrate ABC transporter permease [Rhizobiaceae bacterium]